MRSGVSTEPAHRGARTAERGDREQLGERQPGTEVRDQPDSERRVRGLDLDVFELCSWGPFRTPRVSSPGAFAIWAKRTGEACGCLGLGRVRRRARRKLESRDAARHEGDRTPVHLHACADGEKRLATDACEPRSMRHSVRCDERSNAGDELRAGNVDGAGGGLLLAHAEQFDCPAYPMHSTRGVE